MVAVLPDAASAPVTVREAQRAQTRARILEAVLAIVVDEGMRAVRHRAVADRAGVSLGSTTYHFSSIEELIISAFDYWRSRRVLVRNPFYRDMVALLEPCAGGLVPDAERGRIAGQILELSVTYLRDQLTDKRQDRIIELAFYHESMRYASLRELVVATWQGQAAFLEEVHRQMGSGHPGEDAALTSMLIRQLEQTAVMSAPENLDMASIGAILKRHLSLCFGLDIPSTRGGRHDG